MLTAADVLHIAFVGFSRHLAAVVIIPAAFHCFIGGQTFTCRPVGLIVDIGMHDDLSAKFNDIIKTSF